MVGDHDSIARAHAGFGEVYRHAGKPELALEHSRLALEAFENSGNMLWAAVQTRAVADALTALGRPLEAIQPAQEAVARFREIGSEPYVMDCVVTLAAAMMAAGDIPGASETTDEAVELLLSGGDVKGAAYPLRIYAVCLEALEAVEDPRYEAVLKLASETLYDLYPEGGKLVWHQEIPERAHALASTSPSS
jgi:tetratricopeptide (TPR) repeat protein